MRFFSLSALLVLGVSFATAQGSGNARALDSDHDGLPDAVEQSLLEQFRPQFLISSSDCSKKPAEFTPLLKKPLAAAENGLIYGQAFPLPGRADEVELHFYDLWRKDCGEASHDLDAEHVSVLVDRDSSGSWKARYWYAAAHEDTVCDASQIAQAKALEAEFRGPSIWVSAGKHAAFLSKGMCRHGCGADECDGAEQLDSVGVVNLGEVSSPMNGATWAASPQWPLEQKMRRSDFSAALTARVETLPADEIAWANPGKRPAQAVILGGGAAVGGAATGLRATDSALTTADTHTSGALDTAQRKTGNALVRSYRGVKKALKAATGNKESGTTK
jgi:hypothetical protein